MLSGESAAELECRFKDGRQRILKAVQVFFFAAVGENAGMHVPVARVADDDNGKSGFFRDLVKFLHEFGKPVAGHRHVLRDNRARRAVNRGETGAPGLPIQVGFVFVPGHARHGSSALLQHFQNLLRFAFHRGNRTVDIDQKHRVGIDREAEMHFFFDAADDEIVHELYLCRHDAVCQNPGHDAAGQSYVVEYGDDRPPRCRFGDQAQRDFSDEPQGSFRTREQRDQIVPGTVLHGRTADLQDVSVGQNHFQT
ncbi:MAG: hypothetical protein H6Q07_844, partial [Acidobacteria bacterium]|nr:hypothetical protein [Acidobacteriota bacterium]